MIGNLLSHARFSKMTIKLVRILASVISANVLFAPPLAHAQDFGNLDTARTLLPSYSLISCEPSIVVKIPIYLYTDAYYIQNAFRVEWTGDAVCDSIVSLGIWAQYSTIEAFGADNEMKYALFGSLSQGDAFPPTQEVVAEVYMRCSVTDTFQITFPREEFRIGDLFSNWPITVQNLDCYIVSPDTMMLIAGDADCSGLITISDAVFLIQYIFSGGLSPYDQNAADPDASCIVTISDAVFLINYIFAGGQGPLAGCVNR